MGLGRALFNAFRDQAREDGMESYTLRAFEDSPWALGFYRSLGARPEDEWTVWRVDGEALARLAAGAP